MSYRPFLFWGLFGWLPFFWFYPTPLLLNNRFVEGKGSRRLGRYSGLLFTFFLTFFILSFFPWSDVTIIIFFFFWIISLIGLITIWTVGMFKLCYFESEAKASLKKVDDLEPMKTETSTQLKSTKIQL